MSCSMVPVSHSRAMQSEVRMAAMIIITTAISPGKMKLRETMSVLNQTRGFSSSEGTRGSIPARRVCFSAMSRE